MRGRFITLEGGEGAGKSTLAGGLVDWLTDQGIDVVRTREPGGTAGAEAIRSLLVTGDGDRWDAVTELLLHSAARRDHVVRRIEPALAAGSWVICDRFADSTMAYQGHALGLGRERVAAVTAITVGDLRPDLTFIMDLDPAVGLARAGRRAGDETRYEGRAAAFHEAVRAGFLAIAAAEPDRCCVVDAAAPVETVAADLRQAIADRVGLPVHG